jgi:hypothetical protein
MLIPSFNSNGEAKVGFKYIWKQIVQDLFDTSSNPETESAQDKSFTILNGNRA